MSFKIQDFPTSITYPGRITASGWLTYVPFGMFLVEALRPRVLVELGTFSGVSYCAFCQAVKDLGLETCCYAIDTWQGDPHAGYYGGDVLEDLRAYHDPLYSGFSKLIQSTFDEAQSRFENKSVDLLHIDGLHTYDAVKHDFETWLPKLGDQGVVLFHDISFRDLDFGVWKLWDELKERYRYFEIADGYGLGVLIVGEQIPQGLSQLVELPKAEQMKVAGFFVKLGKWLEEAAVAKSTSTKVIEEQERRLGELEQFVAKVQNNPAFKFYHLLKYQGRR